jgi:hypothetical protein
MVQVIEQLGSVAGRIGKGFAKSLSEQLPKEVATHRLSSGLEKLGKQDFSGKNQLQTLAAIYNIPGMTPEIAALAQQQIQKQNFLNKKPGTPKEGAIPNDQKNAVGASQPIKQPINTIPKKRKDNEFATPEEIEDYKGRTLQAPTFAETKALADTYIEDGLTQNPQEALDMAKRELTQNQEAQLTNTATFRDDFNKRFAKELQDGGLGDYTHVNGKIQQALLDQGEIMVNEGGLTPQQASKEMGDIAYDLGLAANSLNETGSFWNKFRPTSTTINELQQQRKKFEKYGFGHLFDNMVVGKLGITRLEAGHILDPIKNKYLQENLNKIKKHKDIIPFEGQKRKLKDDELDNIISSIDEKDNLYSIEYDLRNKGYDVNQFKKRVTEWKDEKKKKFSKLQTMQMETPIDNSFLGDILFESFKGGK